MIHLDLRNDSKRKGSGICRRDNLTFLADRVCRGEKRTEEAELSVLLCDDPCIQELNRVYRGTNAPTDVLAFSQASAKAKGRPVLGDIVISLETVERYCEGNRRAMHDEVRLLFCHGLLHLLGYKHDSASAKRRMQEKQAFYLFRDVESSWHC